MPTQRRAYRKWLVRALALAALVLLVLSSLFSRQFHSMRASRNSALSRQAALQAQLLEPREPKLALLLAMVGYHASRTEDARSTLLDMVAETVPGSAVPALLARVPADTETITTTTTTPTTTFVETDDTHSAVRKLTRGATAWVISGNYQVLYVGESSGLINVWNLSDPTDPTEYASSPLVGPANPIRHLVLSPDGATLAASTSTGTVWLWGVSNPRRTSRKATLTAAQPSASHSTLTSLQFTQDDNTLLAGLRNGRTVVWHYRPFQVIDHICATHPATIPEGPWQRYLPGFSNVQPCERWTPPTVPVAAW